MNRPVLLTRSNIIRLGGLLFCAYISLLIGLVYLGQIHLRQSLFEQARLTIEKQAATVNYFFNEQQDEIKEFAKNPALNNFFANRAMGMSMEYGLRASLMVARNELERLIKRKKLEGRPVYTRISFVDYDGTVLAVASQNAKYFDSTLLPTSSTLPEISLRLFRDDDGKYRASYIAAIKYHGQITGRIIAEIDLSEVILPLLQHSGNDQLGKTLMLVETNGEILVSTKMLPDSNPSPPTHKTLISVPLVDCGYKLRGFISQNQQTVLTSPWFLASIALLSFPIVGGLFYLLRLNTRHLRLQSKYNTSQLQEHATKQVSKRVNAVLAGIDAIVYVTDMETSTVLYANAAARSLYGDLTGKTCWQALYSQTNSPCSFCPRDSLIQKDGQVAQAQIMEFQHSENKLWFHSSDCAIPWDDGRYVHLRVATDITSRIQNEQDLHDAHRQLKVLAYYDPLTRLANRRLFVDRLKHAFSKADRNNTGLAICYLDLDEFKQINDTYDHETGDELLVQVSNRLLKNLRNEDTVARWGGDEFALLINEQNDESTCALTMARLLESLTDPYHLENGIFKVTTSIGLTLYPQDKGDPETLLRHADQAMYMAKQKGKNRFQFFDPEQDRRINEQREKIDRIGKAIEDDELLLFYQPKIDMQTGIVMGVETLVRWQHPENGLLVPFHFLPLIEGHPLQLSLDWWVLRAAVQQISMWGANGETMPVSINVSAQAIQQHNFSNRLCSLLGEFQVDGRLIELEILESGILDDLDTISSVILQCTENGITFALDDYGTGFSSLTHIRRLPVQSLKIDQSFVRGMHDSLDDYHIVEGVIGLARAFELKVIAEGVETEEIGIQLLEMGCRYAQGYHIARPMPESDLHIWKKQYIVPEKWKDVHKQLEEK